MAKTPDSIPVTLNIDVTAKGRAVVALADASEATAAALLDVLAARQASGDSDGKDLGRLVMAARRSADKADWLADRSLARANLARAAALLIAAIENADAEDDEAAALPVVGRMAWHKNHDLDPRRVVRVEAESVYLELPGGVAGPFPASNYTYSEAGQR